MKWFLPSIAAAALLCAGPARAEQTLEVEEYGLRMALPDGAPVCEGRSWTHLHGYYAPFSGDCEHSERGVSLWADWNAAFFRIHPDVTACPEQGGSLEAGAALGLSFPGHPSMTCLRTWPDRIEVSVSTQAWRWGEPDEDLDEDMRESARNLYTAILWTTPQDFDADMARFRAIMDSVRLTPPPK